MDFSVFTHISSLLYILKVPKVFVVKIYLFSEENIGHFLIIFGTNFYKLCIFISKFPIICSYGALLIFSISSNIRFVNFKSLFKSL